ncbi:MAG: hypothetical protein MRERV_66c010 [Mycoplasmataceae bacterium RV_VA103A]|nr:MAG: hypothetical protein MRERV_66c010 [Mycoplasmataceae bacterium RV_VA103A]
MAKKSGFSCSLISDYCNYFHEKIIFSLVLLVNVRLI